MEARIPLPLKLRLRATTFAFAGAATALVLACGGGGDEVPTPTATFPPQIAPTLPLLEATATPTPTVEVQAAQEYTVQPGDTLGAIAAQFGVSVEDIVAANEIANPDLIQPGDVLTIPTP